MNSNITDNLICPSCRVPTLDLAVESRNGQILEGSLRCSDCHVVYSITGGVPRLVRREDLVVSPTKAFGFQWGRWLTGAFEQDQIYGSDFEKETKEFHDYVGLSREELRSKRVLDAGCGSGRLTRYLGTLGCEVVGMDVHSALSDVLSHCKDQHLVNIVQGSILKPPLKEETFDLVWSEGVIHHTGDTPGAFDQLARLVKPGGRLFVWVYWDEELNIYRRVRNTLRLGHKLPMPVLFGLCYTLATLLYAGAFVRGLPGSLTRRRKITPLRLHAFRLFDHISPEHNTQHSEAEVRGWFEKNGFVNVQRVADLGVRGDRPA